MTFEPSRFAMGLYDNILPDDLRADLRRFAELILELDASHQLLEATPRLLKVLGDLRAKIFAYEVRSTGRFFPKEGGENEPGEEKEAPAADESRRIVEEAIRRLEEMEKEWTHPWEPEKPPE